MEHEECIVNRPKHIGMGTKNVHKMQVQSRQGGPQPGRVGKEDSEGPKCAQSHGSMNKALEEMTFLDHSKGTSGLKDRK